MATVPDSSPTKGAIRVVVVDDHEMILQSVVRLLTADARIEVVGTALTATEGIEVVIQMLPDVLVIDYHLPDMDAPEAIRILHQAIPEIRIVTISGSDKPGSFYESMQAGSSAWVRKTRAIQELRLAILRVASGEPYISEGMEAQPNLDELVVHYQPIVDLENWRIVGFEALVRWQHPERGLLFPDSFLPHLVETGFIQEIDLWVLRQATLQLAQWQNDFPRTPRLFISVNMSYASIENPNLPTIIAEEVQFADLGVNDLVVEIRESFLVSNPQETVELLTRFNAEGIRLALEDFGASFSPISYIHRVPFDGVKIGRSFTRELPASMGTVWVIEGIASATQAMSTMCIAEGVEELAQLNSLRDAGMRYGQGFLFSPPARAAVCEGLLTRDSLLPDSAPAADATSSRVML